MLEALQINLDITVKIIFFQSRFLKWFLVLAHHLRRHAEAPLVAAAMVIHHNCANSANNWKGGVILTAYSDLKDKSNTICPLWHKQLFSTFKMLAQKANDRNYYTLHTKSEIRVYESLQLLGGNTTGFSELPDYV
ncbi:hypothetical protein OUZ56_027556 [Daphnia magna]|uniref:Uncharacterized protein n=1 Tax=Daphnia magna TaxID=35525 RepID=A0ABR0B183_9CRUS|nr:hypothetical protein OUZ56_027556 [Daphnia magna]